MDEELYKQIENKGKEFQLLLKRANNEAMDKAHEEMKKHVEDHFDKLMKALIARKNELLEVVDHIFKQNGIYLFIIVH